MEKQLHFPDSRSGKGKQSPKPAFPKKTHAKRARNGQMAAPPVMRTDAEAWEIVSRNMGLISLGLRKWGLGNFPSQHMEDLRSIAVISLFNSAKHWNESEGTFSTYAIARMRECVRDAHDFLNNISIPPQVLSRILGYLSWKSKNPGGSAVDFAEYAGITQEDARQVIGTLPLFFGLRQAGNLHSILYRQPAREEDSAFFSPEASHSTVSPEIRSKMRGDAEEAVVRENAKAKLLEFIWNSGLVEGEKEVLGMCLYGNGKQGGLSTGEIAEVRGVTPARISQILKKAMRKLRKHRGSELREILESFDEG